ncbi:MAG: hypothetical protein EPO00_05530 [Chloroflexota bacterium]|nr:MAG: hypothetical protein EPO00_05530 [Chloroflexota bacterium]
MSDDYIVMHATDTSKIDRVLADTGLKVEPHASKSGGFDFALRCSRGDASVVLAVTRPDHWVEAADVRKDLAIVAMTRASALRPWKRGQEIALRDEIVAALQPLAWSGPSADDAQNPQETQR